MVREKVGDDVLPDYIYQDITAPISTWYDGPSLWEAMSSLPEPRRKLDAPLRMTIHNFFNHSSSGLILLGKILTGTLRVGDRVVLTPLLNCIPPDGRLTVVSIQSNKKPLNRAIPGDMGKLFTQTNPRSPPTT